MGPVTEVNTLLATSPVPCFVANDHMRREFETTRGLRHLLCASGIVMSALAWTEAQACLADVHVYVYSSISISMIASSCR